MLFEQCPHQYRQRYVEGLASPPSLAMLFGHTVHTALEVLHQGHRGSCPANASVHTDHYECARGAYYREFEVMRARLAEEGVTAGGELYMEGLRMIDQVAAMALNGDGRSRAERWFTIPTEWGGLDWPVVGAVDLWCPPWSRFGAVVWDFKTTIGSWSETRALKERWQPLLYSWAYLRAFDVLPTFRYLVLNRTSGAVDFFDRVWDSRSDFEHDLADLEFAAEEIAEAVAQGNFECTRGHGTCLECGERFGHDHVCATPKRHKLTLTGASSSLS